MKKIMIVLMLLASFFVGTATVNATTIPMPIIEVEGYVNPFIGTKTDNLDGTTTFSQVNYFFDVIASNVGSGINYVKLEFENDVFFDIGTVDSTSPNDWIESSYGFNGSIYEIFNAGTTVGVGERLIISMNDVIVHTEALLDSGLWQEGQVWGQSWLAKNTMDGSDGGSTAPVPEPGTLMLLGSGLAGVGIYTRRKKSN